MAGNNSIQFLRGNNISGSDEELLPGQPAYDLTTKYLYVGDGSKISETSPIKASFADDAENVTSTINGKNISDIFEENGTTVKEATHAVSATEAETAENSPKSIYNLGAYDTYVDNGDGTVTVTRKTGRYDVPINNFIVSGDHFEQSISLPNGDTSYGTDTGYNANATSNVYKLAFYGIDKSFYVAGDNWLRIWDSSYTKDVTGLAQFKAALEEAGGMYILYETTTSYTEKLPANVPINTLDQHMSDIVREEVEKTLNFCQVKDPATGSRIYIGTVSAGTYSICLNESPANNIGYQFQLFPNISTQTPIFTANVISTKTTFTVTETTDLYLYANGKVGTFSVMLNAGSNIYPYQPYNGAIVHEKQLNEYTPIGIKPYLSAHNSTSGSWVKFAEITVDTFCAFGAAFIISRGYESQAMCILRWQQRVGSNGSNTSTELSILAGDSIGSDIVLTDTDNGSSHTYALYFNTTTQDSYANISLLVDRAGNFHNMNFPTSAVMQGEPSNIIQRASVLLPGGGTVQGNLSITGQLDFASLSTRAANALLSMVELSESPLRDQRVSWGGPNAVWSTNGSTWSHSGTIMALGYVTELSTTGNVTSATYNSSTNRITYVISVNRNPGSNVYSGYVRYKYVIKKVK